MSPLTVILLVVALCLATLGHEIATYLWIAFAVLNQAVFTWAARPEEA